MCSYDRTTALNNTEQLQMQSRPLVSENLVGRVNIAGGNILSSVIHARMVS
jgi:hypothetical protein